MEKLPKVVVIMSTYNGEKFIKEQIDSILAQKDVDVTLHIFDDVSKKDKTVNIIREYEKNNKNVIVHINEKNKNYTYNFLDALFSFRDNQDYDYYAFSDQDDFWLDTKLISAINKIKEKGECTLYSANLKVVDGELNYSGVNMLDGRGKTDSYEFSHFDEICYNIVTGCTCVMDNAFKNLATKHYPQNLECHDYWLGLIANYCAESNYVFDSCPDYILYRQHGKNLVGAVKVNFWRRVYNFLFKKDDKIISMLKLLYDTYGEELDLKDKEVIEKFINYRKNGNKRFLGKTMKCNFTKKLKIRLFFNKFK